MEELIKCAEKVAAYEKKYFEKKRRYDLLKANYILCSDWETLLDVKKPTQKQKDAYVDVETANVRREVEELKVKLDYWKKVYEICLKNF